MLDVSPVCCRASTERHSHSHLHLWAITVYPASSHMAAGIGSSPLVTMNWMADKGLLYKSKSCGLATRSVFLFISVEVAKMIYIFTQLIKFTLAN